MREKVESWYRDSRKRPRFSGIIPELIFVPRFPPQYARVVGLAVSTACTAFEMGTAVCPPFGQTVPTRRPGRDFNDKTGSWRAGQEHNSPWMPNNAFRR